MDFLSGLAGTCSNPVEPVEDLFGYTNMAGEDFIGIAPDIAIETWFNDLIAQYGLEQLVQMYPYQPMKVNKATGIIEPINQDCTYNARLTNCFHVLYQRRRDKMIQQTVQQASPVEQVPFQNVNMMNPSFLPQNVITTNGSVQQVSNNTQAALSVNPQQVIPSNQAYSLNLGGLFDKSDKVERSIEVLPENMIRSDDDPELIRFNPTEDIIVEPVEAGSFHPNKKEGYYVDDDGSLIGKPLEYINPLFNNPNYGSYYSQTPYPTYQQSFPTSSVFQSRNSYIPTYRSVVK